MTKKLFVPVAAALLLAGSAAAADHDCGVEHIAPGENPPEWNVANFAAITQNFETETAPPPGPPLTAGKGLSAGGVAPQPTGALSGRIVYTSAGHGWTNDNTGTGEWYTQRGDNNELVEDFGNQIQMTLYADAAFRAGATVVPFRPVGKQINEVVIDNDDPEAVFTPSGSWSSSTNPQFFGDASDPAHYRFATKSTVETATARYTPNIPEAGFYPVYCWTRDGVDRVDDQLYRIVHTGGTSEVRINHRKVGKGWIYLGTHYFHAGTSGYVEVSNQSSSTPGTYVFADAIRFGNGMGDIPRGGSISGFPREDEASLYWIENMIGQGAPTDITFRLSADSSSNVGAPPRMISWMNAEGEGSMTDRVFLSFHSNAFDPGSLGLFNGNNDGAVASTPNQEQWAEIIAAELNDDLVQYTTFEHPWPNRRTLGLSLTLDRSDIEFGEIRGNAINDEADATIIEVAAHGNATEAQLMRDLDVRRAVAKAAVQGTIRYFNTFGGGPLAFPPAQPGNVAATTDASGNVTISWDVPPSGQVEGDPATGYRIYRSPNGYGYGQPADIGGGTTTSATFSDVPVGDTTYFVVAATNAGGESRWSEPVGVRRSASGTSSALIVNGFDRIDRFMNPRQFVTTNLGGPAGGGGTVDRVNPAQINTEDYVVPHGEALATAPASFDSASNEAVIDGSVALTNYDAVFWILGEESTADDTFDPTERSLVSSFIGGGGKFFVSGAEIGWDLEAQGADPGFFNNTLRTDYATDDANTYTGSGAAGSVLAGISFDFSPGPQKYDANFPDTFNTISGSGSAATYSTSGIAATQYPAPPAAAELVVLGFPFELIAPVSSQEAIMTQVAADFGITEVTSVEQWMILD